jgi:hypothetical protein
MAKNGRHPKDSGSPTYLDRSFEGKEAKSGVPQLLQTFSLPKICTPHRGQIFLLIMQESLSKTHSTFKIDCSNDLTSMRKVFKESYVLWRGGLPKELYQIISR